MNVFAHVHKNIVTVPLPFIFNITKNVYDADD